MAAVSVVIPVHNSERYLRECLDSVVAQSVTDLEIICVDDGSTDDSPAILREYAARDERMTVITQDNLGVATARNAGLDRAAGEYVLFLDSDDWFDPTMIEELRDRSVEDDAQVSMCRIRYYYADRDTFTEAYWSLQTDLFPDHKPFSHRDMEGNIFLAITPCVWNKMFLRSFLIDKGIRFDTELTRAEDVAFTYCALALADRLTFVDAALVSYRTGVRGTLQDTVHVGPVEICKALGITKRKLSEFGVFGDVERAFVNAALHECLFTLESVSTTAAYYELFGALKSRYFAELGIRGRTPEYFDSRSDYERLMMIESLGAEEYLVSDGRIVRERFRQTQGELSRALRAERDLASQVVSAQEDARALGKRLAKTEARLEKTTSKLETAKAKLARLQGSAWYRLGRAISYLPRRVVRGVRARGRAE